MITPRPSTPSSARLATGGGLREQKKPTPTAATRSRHATAVLLSTLLAAGCAGLSHYDPTSYKTATDLKAEALLLLPKASEPPEAHKAEIEGIRLKAQQALEYEKGKGDTNSLTLKQWETLTDPHAGLLGEFLQKWQSENKPQNPTFIQGASKNVSDAFDEIIKLEQKKVKK